ncbi:MAG: hypothetical protein ACFFBD_10155, partial [Candidatus Hodarchaeota archaeon]
ISDKYTGIADWGVLQTGIIIDLRAVFIMGEGVKIIPVNSKAESQRELDWIEDFFDYNDYDAEGLPDLAKEAEIEGKIALKIMFDKEAYSDNEVKQKLWKGMITSRYISYLSKKYTVKTDPNDYMWYKTLEWTPTGQTKAEVLNENEFVYKKFGGRLNNPNEALPKIGRCLTQIDNLDKGIRDWRLTNHLFAAPTPWIKCLTAKDVEDTLTNLEKKNWKIGKLLATTGDFKLVSVSMDGIDSLMNEIEVNAKFISGNTGVPVHFLGLLDLLKSKATGESVREVMSAATTQERVTWKGAIKELITKSMRMWNKVAYPQKSQANWLDPDKISVEIPVITQEHWDRIEKVLIPAAIAGIVSKEFVRDQIPGVDTEAEEAKKKEDEESEFKKMQDEMEEMRNQQNFNNITNIEEIV